MGLSFFEGAATRGRDPRREIVVSASGKSKPCVQALRLGGEAFVVGGLGGV
jgi:hypothetical protein